MGAARTELVIASRVPREISNALRRAAQEADRSISGQIRKVLREWAETQASADESGLHRVK
jgi:hypothetical protein